MSDANLNDPNFDGGNPANFPTGMQPTNDEKNLAMIAHGSGLAGIIAGGLVGFVGPLVVYVLKKDSSPFVESQAKEALNFQITLLIAGLVLGAITILSCGSLIPITVPLGLLILVCQIVDRQDLHDRPRLWSLLLSGYNRRD